MEPISNPAEAEAAAQLEQKDRAERMEKLTAGFRDVLPFFLEGQEELEDGTVEANDTMALVSPDEFGIEGFEGDSFIDLPEEERGAIELIILEQIGLTWDTMEGAEYRFYKLEDGVIVTVFETDGGDNKALHCVQYTDEKHPGKRHWMIGPKDSPVWFS